MSARGSPPTGAAAHRLFIALWPTPAARRALQDWLAPCTWPAGAAVVAPERLHVTLHFLGQVPAARVPALRTALQAPALALAPGELCFDRVQHWAHGVVVLAPAAVPEPLARLHTQLAQVLDDLGLPVEARPFRPHVTLARKAAGAVLPDAPAAPRGLCWPVRGYALVESAGGYRTLQRYAPPA